MALTCKTHPNSAAGYTCFDCRGPICDACVRTRDDGVIVCQACLDGDIALAGESPATAERAFSPPPPARACVTHPQVAAIVGCSVCGSLICSTCDFVFGAMHLCPKCALGGTQAVSPQRKSLGIWGLVIAIANVPASIVGLLFITRVIPEMRGDSAAAANLLSSAVLVVCMGLAVGGFLMTLYAFERKSVNPGYFWIGPVINGLISGFWLLLMLSGLVAILQH